MRHKTTKDGQIITEEEEEKGSPQRGGKNVQRDTDSQICDLFRLIAEEEYQVSNIFYFISADRELTTGCHDAPATYGEESVSRVWYWRKRQHFTWKHHGVPEAVLYQDQSQRGWVNCQRVRRWWGWILEFRRILTNFLAFCQCQSSEDGRIEGVLVLLQSWWTFTWWFMQTNCKFVWQRV